MSTIPLFEAQGSHREAGQIIGSACRLQIKRMLSDQRASLPDWTTWADMLSASAEFLDISRKIYPQYVDELVGIAEGADLPFDEIFLSICEELWERAIWKTGCTDMAARGSATTDGSTLIAHTNDLDPAAEEGLVLLKIKTGDEPEFLGISPGGVAFSAGFNNTGISLTGNQLNNNDLRPGVPRLLVVRAILGSANLTDAIRHCLLPQRASSYNNVIADRNGEVYSMEGSATDCEPIYIQDDIMAHSNHYISPRMRHFEAEPGEIGSSILRYNRALRLLRENYGDLSVELFKELLGDHAGYPASICKHGPDSVTVFSVIIQTEGLRAWVNHGRACEEDYFEYSLATEQD